MTAPDLECRAVTKTFGGVRAVDGVTLAVPRASLCALIGPNGAGKTTLFNVATNLFAPTSGEVCFFGKNTAGMTPQRLAALGSHPYFSDRARISRVDNAGERDGRWAFTPPLVSSCADVLDPQISIGGIAANGDR